MINQFNVKKGNGLCCVCDEKIGRMKAYVILEIKEIPPKLFLFHIDHYKIYIEILEDYIKRNENPIIRSFVDLSKYRIKEENKVAIDQGIKYEFEGDLREVINFKACKEIVRTLKKEYSCKIHKKTVTIKDCFKCNINWLCPCQLLFS